MLQAVALAFLSLSAPPPPLFRDDAPLVLRLATDLRALLRDRGEERKEHEARLRFTTATGDTASVKVAVRTRGIFRLKKCDFPPLRLDLPKGKLEGTPFEGQNKLKLVTHCRGSRSPYEQNVLQEYALYRVFNVVTPLSYRTRLARVTYVDTTRPDSLTYYAFLIESDAALAERSEGKELEADNIHDLRIEPSVITQLAVFQYLIGNTDWSVWKRHNIAIAQKPDGGLLAFPYDFDFAGVIAAPYALPDARLPIKSVRDRLYRGFCQPDSVVAPVLARFRAAKDSIYAAVRAVPDLDPREAKQMLEYFDGFYRTLENERSARREFRDNCRPVPQ